MSEPQQCPECAEPAVHRPPTASPWTEMYAATGHDVPEWSHADGEPLCPVMGDEGYEPATPVSRAEHTAQHIDQDADDDTDGM